MIWNIVDRREHRYRWAQINAIIEATWQDNGCAEADQAPVDETSSNVTYDQRESLSVREAIAWADVQECAVTLYLYDKGKGTP